MNELRSLFFEEIRMLTHALGYDLEGNSWLIEPYRTWYCSRVPPSSVHKVWRRLKRQGLADRAAPKHDEGDLVYWLVTPFGQAVVLEWLCHTPLSERRRVAWKEDVRPETVKRWRSYIKAGRITEGESGALPTGLR